MLHSLCLIFPQNAIYFIILSSSVSNYTFFINHAPNANTHSGRVKVKSTLITVAYYMLSTTLLSGT